MPDVRLDLFSDRALSMIASAVHGAPVTVVRSSRCRAPAALAMDGRTLFLDGERLGPYDLLVLAGLFRHRRECSSRASVAATSPENVARWLEAESAHVLRRFPGAANLKGLYRRVADTTIPAGMPAVEGGSLPEVTWHDVTLRPLDAEQLARAGLGALSVRGLGLLGADDDLARIAEAIVAGKLPVKEHPALTELPYVEVPLRLEVPATPEERRPVDVERLREIDEGARGIVKCIQEKLQGLHEQRVPMPRTLGTRLHPGRLHDAFLANRTGAPAHIFRRPPAETDAVFRPDRHLAVMGFDVHSLHAAIKRHGRLSLNFIRMLVRVYEMLEIESVVVTFSDQVLDLPDGRRVYLHMPHVAKALDEPFGPRVWSRLEAAWSAPRGTENAACFVPLQLATMERLSRGPVQENQPRYLKLDYYSLDGLPPPHADDATLERVADATERVLKRFRDETASEVDLGVFLPKALIRRAAKGSIVSTLSDLGI